MLTSRQQLKYKKRTAAIIVGNQKLENVDQFRQLELLVTKDDYCIKETISRIAVAKNVHQEEINFNKQFKLRLRENMIKC